MVLGEKLMHKMLLKHCCALDTEDTVVKGQKSNGKEKGKKKKNEILQITAEAEAKC